MFIAIFLPHEIPGQKVSMTMIIISWRYWIRLNLLGPWVSISSWMLTSISFNFDPAVGDFTNTDMRLNI